MVELSYFFRVQAPVAPLWDYFSQFETIAEWDPNVVEAKVIQKKASKVGTVYNIKTLWNGEVSDIQYTVTKYVDKENIFLTGKNLFVCADDQINFRKITEKVTQLQYRADICLRGVLFLFTPLILRGLDKIAKEAHEGMIKKCQQKFGSPSA